MPSTVISWFTSYTRLTSLVIESHVVWALVASLVALVEALAVEVVVAEAAVASVEEDLSKRETLDR